MKGGKHARKGGTHMKKPKSTGGVQHGNLSVKPDSQRVSNATAKKGKKGY